MPRMRAAAAKAGSTPTVIWRAEIGDHAIDLAWSPTGDEIAVAAVAGPIHLFRRTDGRARVLDGHVFGTLSLAWHPGGDLLASGGQDGRIRLWAANRGEAARGLDAGAAWVAKVAWGRAEPLGIVLVSAAGRTLRFWSETGHLLRDCPDHPSTIADLAWRPSGGVVAACGYGGALLWDPAVDAPVKALRWKGSSLALAWSPDGRFLATGEQDSSVHYWIVASTTDLQMTGYPTKVREISWDPSGRFLATGGGPRAVVWDCSGRGPEGRAPIVLEGHDEPLTAVAFAPAGSRLACADRTGRVAFWDLAASRASLRSSYELGEGVSRLAWSGDAQWIAVAGDRGAVAMIAAE